MTGDGFPFISSTWAEYFEKENKISLNRRVARNLNFFFFFFSETRNLLARFNQHGTTLFIGCHSLATFDCNRSSRRFTSLAAPTHFQTHKSTLIFSAATRLPLDRDHYAAPLASPSNWNGLKLAPNFIASCKCYIQNGAHFNESRSIWSINLFLNSNLSTVFKILCFEYHVTWLAQQVPPVGLVAPKCGKFVSWKNFVLRQLDRPVG